MSEDRSAEEKRFIVFHSDSIKTFAEENGNTNVHENVFLLLSEDVTYRLREVIHNAAHYMKHCKRKRLTCDDINRSLRSSSCAQIFGYHKEPNAAAYVPEAKVFSVEDEEVDLVDAAKNIILESPSLDLTISQPSVDVQWLSLDGFTNENLLDQDNNEINNKECSRELVVYYETLTKTILEGDLKQLKIVLNDLSSNSKIQKLVPDFMSFISINIRKSTNDLEKIKALLLTLASLMSNQNLYFYAETYLMPIIQAVLVVVLEPLRPSLNREIDHWQIRELGAYLVVSILHYWESGFVVQKFFISVIDSLKACLLDRTKPFSSHYGAIVCFKLFGYESIHAHLYSILSDYWNHLELAMKNNHPSQGARRYEAQMVYFALLDTSRFYLQKLMEMTVQSSGNVSHEHANSVYNQLSLFFEDSLSCSLVPDQEKLLVLIHKDPKKIATNLFIGPETGQTGEELLDAFYETVGNDEEMVSNVEEDPHWSDDNSGDSETEKGLVNENEDLLIKSTISDPSHGIKLTIKKVRRLQETSVSEKTQQLKNRKRKKALKLFRDPSEPIFEESNIRSRQINIHIQGAVAKKASPQINAQKTTTVSRCTWNYLSKRLQIKRLLRASRKNRTLEKAKHCFYFNYSIIVV